MFGLNIDPRNPKGNPNVAELSDLKVEWVRFTYYEPQGGDQLSERSKAFYLDKTQKYAAAGIRPLVILTYDTYPNKPGFHANWDSYLQRFSRRAAQIADLLKPYNPVFQIWNEPDHDRKNIGTSYDPCLREDVYAKMLIQTGQAIRRVMPQAKIVTAGMVSGDWNWVKRVIDLQGGTLQADYLAFHPYGQRPSRDWPHSNWAFGSRSYIGILLNGYYGVAKKPMWISEIGVKTQDVDNDPQKVAEFVRRYYDTILTHYTQKVKQVFWFCYADGMVNPFGLVDGNGRPKPSYHVYRAAAHAYAKSLTVEPAPRPIPTPPPVITPTPIPLPSDNGTPVTPTPQPTPQPTPVITPAPVPSPLTPESYIQYVSIFQRDVDSLHLQITQLGQRMALLQQQIDHNPAG